MFMKHLTFGMLFALGTAMIPSEGSAADIDRLAKRISIIQTEVAMNTDRAVSPSIKSNSGLRAKSKLGQERNPILKDPTYGVELVRQAALIRIALRKMTAEEYKKAVAETKDKLRLKELQLAWDTSAAVVNTRNGIIVDDIISIVKADPKGADPKGGPKK